MGDDDHRRKILRRCLKKAGYGVNPEEALGESRDKHPTKHYLISINGKWVGGWYDVDPENPQKGRFFSPTEFKSIEEAEGHMNFKEYFKMFPSVRVEIWESWGMGPEQRRIVKSMNMKVEEFPPIPEKIRKVLDGRDKRWGKNGYQWMGGNREKQGGTTLNRARELFGMGDFKDFPVKLTFDDCMTVMGDEESCEALKPEQIGKPSANIFNIGGKAYYGPTGTGKKFIRAPEFDYLITAGHNTK